MLIKRTFISQVCRRRSDRAHGTIRYAGRTRGGSH